MAQFASYFARYNLFRRPNPQRLRQFNHAFDQALSVGRTGSIVAQRGR